MLSCKGINDLVVSRKIYITISKELFQDKKLSCQHVSHVPCIYQLFPVMWLAGHHLGKDGVGFLASDLYWGLPCVNPVKTLLNRNFNLLKCSLSVQTITVQSLLIFRALHTPSNIWFRNKHTCCKEELNEHWVAIYQASMFMFSAETVSLYLIWDALQTPIWKHLGRMAVFVFNSSSWHVLNQMNALVCCRLIQDQYIISL